MPFTTFDVNIFGTTHVDLDGQNNVGYLREFVLHVLQVECNQTITNFDMFIEFYAFNWGITSGSVASPNWIVAPNGSITDMFDNSRPQVIHLDTMTPNSPVVLEPSCTIPAAPCPSPADMRLFSMFFQVPISASLTGYKITDTNMYNGISGIAELPVNITIIADGCRYSSEVGTTINIYKEYVGGATDSLFGSSSSNPNNYPIGFNEKITIS